MNSTSVKDQLLKLSTDEIHERESATRDWYYYKGKMDKDRYKETHNPIYLGQNWESKDKVDYEQIQVIDNKVKPLLKKQARWMFGKSPDIEIKVDDLKDKDCGENLRKYLEDILNETFWRDTKNAFLNCSIKKRILARVVAIPSTKKLKIKYEDIDNVSYKEINGELVEALFFAEDRGNYNKPSEEKIYYIHKYFYDKIGENEVLEPSYVVLTYKGDDLENPIKEEKQEIGFDYKRIPCFIIKNDPGINNMYGHSDVEDLKDLQNERNRKQSDFAEALKFQFFGSLAIVDGNKEDVDALTVAPGSVHAIRTSDEALANGKQAKLEVQEYNMGNSEGMISWLEQNEQAMKEILDMPDISQLNNIPSAKAMKYLYNDLIARCEEKWTDWNPYLFSLIEYIINISPQMKLDNWDKNFSTLQCTISFNHNYPIPDDEEDKKSSAIDEVEAGVRSKRSYLRDISKEEDPETAYNEILEEMKLEGDVNLGISNPNSSNYNNEDKEEEIDNE